MSNSETLSFVRLRSTQRSAQRSHAHRQTYRQRGGGIFPGVSPYNPTILMDITTAFTSDPILSQFSILLTADPKAANTSTTGAFTPNPARVSDWLKAIKYQDKLLRGAYTITDSKLGIPSDNTRSDYIMQNYETILAAVQSGAASIDYDKYIRELIPLLSLIPYTVKSGPISPTDTKWHLMFIDNTRDANYRPAELQLLLANPARVENKLLRVVARVIHSLIVSPLGVEAPIHAMMRLLKGNPATALSTLSALINKYVYYVMGSIMTETNAGLRDSWRLNDRRVNQDTDNGPVSSLSTFFTDFFNELAANYTLDPRGGTGTFIDPTVPNRYTVGNTYGKAAAYYLMLRVYHPLAHATLEDTVGNTPAGGDPAATVKQHADQSITVFLTELNTLKLHGKRLPTTASDPLPGDYIGVPITATGMTFKNLVERVPYEQLMFLFPLEGAYEEVINE